MHGKPLALVSDWYKESDINDSGFSEAAADALFAALVKLNADLGGDVFRSPLHFIGHSRGTVVNSEVIQRLGPTSHDREHPDDHAGHPRPEPVVPASAPVGPSENRRRLGVRGQRE